MGGLIGRVLSYTRIAERFGAKVSDVKLDPGGGANETGEHFQAANQDAAPLPGDYLVTVRVQRTGGQVVVGFIDPKQQQTAEPGEHRIYARNANGEQLVQLHLKKDGTAVLNNANGAYTLNPDGSAVVTTPDGDNTFATDGAFTSSTGARITSDGDFVTASGVSLDNHPHNQGDDSGGNTEQPTAPPTATE